MELNSVFHYEGWQIRYRRDILEQPQDKTVVFVHGTPWSSIVYRPIVEALLASESCHTLVYDLPGYGRSQEFVHPSGGERVIARGFEGNTSVKFQANALSALLAHLGLVKSDGRRPPAVIAHDIAGAIVLRAHLLNGANFDSIFLADTNAVLPWGDGLYKLVRSDPQTFLKLPPAIFDAMVRAAVRSACHDARVLQAGWEDALAEPWRSQINNDSRQTSFVRQIVQANDKDVAEMLEENMYQHVRCDVKIIWGEQDQWIPKTKIEELIRKIGSKVKNCAFIPNAGHLVMLDQPARFAVEVFDWLNDETRVR